MAKIVLKYILISLDLLLFVSIFFLVNYLENANLSLSDFLLVIAVTVFLIYSEQIYNITFDFWQEIKSIYKALFLSYLISLAYISVSDTDISINFINTYFLYLFIMIPIEKRYSKKILYFFDIFKTKVLLVGYKQQMDTLRHELEENWYLGMKYSEENYDHVIISSKYISTEEMDNIITRYLNENSKLFIVPYITQVNFANSTIIEYNNIRLNTVQIENKLLIKKNLLIKNSFDMIVSIMILPVFLLLHLIMIALIKYDSKGSVFFKQKRIGKDGIEFTCYKYRTMYENSDEILQSYLKKHPQEVEYYKQYHKYQNDPRITKIGKILRATSLDELPQLLNVLKKEMSLIGPRPYMIEELDSIGEYKELIFKIKPGITGLWQVSGRNELTFNERLELDSWYIKNWSLWADFVILIKTVKVVFLKIGAK